MKVLFFIIFGITIGITIFGLFFHNPARVLSQKATIKCYSAGKLIYEGKSSTRIKDIGNSNYVFKEFGGTRKFVSVSGDCIITNTSKYDN